MQFKIFTYSIFSEQSAVEEMNRFLRGNKVLNVDKQLITTENGAFWTFCVHYLGMPNSEPQTFEKKEKVDYKNILDEKTFEIFSKLRAFRKKLAEDDAVPAYAVFTDAELAEISKLAEISPKNLQTINGIGEKKVEKYGNKLCEMYKETT